MLAEVLIFAGAVETVAERLAGRDPTRFEAAVEACDAVPILSSVGPDDDGSGWNLQRVGRESIVNHRHLRRRIARNGRRGGDAGRGVSFIVRRHTHAVVL